MKKLLTLLFVSGFLFGQDTKEKMRSIVDSYSLQDYQSEYNHFHNYKNLPNLIHKPKIFDIALFPSSLFHRTIPFSSQEDRQVIAFDLVPKQSI